MKHAAVLEQLDEPPTKQQTLDFQLGKKQT
jgi:hypothetical protein